jgi:hypothetical protein
MTEINYTASRLLLHKLTVTQSQIAPSLGTDVHRATRAALLKRIAGDLTAAFVMLAEARLPGRRRLPWSTNVESVSTMLEAAGVYDDGFVMPRCRAAVRKATRAALAEEGGQVSEVASATTFLELVIEHAATLRDLAEQAGNEDVRYMAVERHRRALVSLENLDTRPDPLALPPLPSEAPAVTVQ